MRTLGLMLVAIAGPAAATELAAAQLDATRLERLLGLRHSASGPPPITPPSPLSWRLLGTLRARDGASLAAVECSMKSVTLSVGDVREGVEVVSIEQQFLVVRREGRLEQVGGKPMMASLAIPPPRQSLSRQLVMRALANPAELLNEVQLLPAMRDGKLSGFRARWVKEGSLVASLGLKSGDVVTKVNGMPLDSLDRVGTLFQVLMTTRRFEVELEREGKRVVESVELDR